MVFAESTYSNLIKQSQENVWRLIKEDTTVQTFTKDNNILNNMPAGVTSSVGFPYIIVPAPTISEERLTMNQKRIILTFDIEIWIKRIENLALIDRIRTLLSSNEGTFSGTYILHQFLNSGAVNYIELPDGQKVQQYILSVQYEWIGSPS
jgi:hypothetical protein